MNYQNHGMISYLRTLEPDMSEHRFANGRVPINQPRSHFYGPQPISYVPPPLFYPPPPITAEVAQLRMAEQEVMAAEHKVRMIEDRLAKTAVCGGSLAGKVVLVTGCSRGLGLGFAQHLIERDATVIATCRNPSGATKLMELLETSASSFAVALDVDDPTSIADAVAYITGTVSHIDILINNAGISTKDHPNDPIISANPEEALQVYKTNVLGPMM